MASIAPGSADRPPRRQAPAVKRRAQIIEAALSCFSERGYHATTMDHLVAASGLSKGSLYWHFESKEDVFLAVFDHIAQEIFGRLDEGAGDRDVVSLLRGELALFLKRFGAERRLALAWLEFMNHPRGRERMAELYREARARFTVLIQAGIDAGELRALPAPKVAAVLMGMVDALILQSALDPDFQVEDHESVVWDVLHYGVAPEESDREKRSARRP
jgi:AcrR family transcriptional regulator